MSEIKDFEEKYEEIFVIPKMREATEQESEIVNKYIKQISKPLGTNFYDILKDNNKEKEK